MRMRKLLTVALVVITYAAAFGQVPSIQNVSPLNTFNNDTLVITGSGFSATPANLDVWFGPVKGTIITSSDFAIEVKVPAQATLTNVRVINKTSQSSATSELKFMPSLKTEPFDPTKFAAPLSFTASQELWDLCLCDLNVDGKPDIASTKFARAASPYLASQDIMILQNNSTPGSLAFSKLDRTNFAAVNLGYATDNIQCGDLNGDGKPELVVARGSDPRNSIIIFKNTSPGGVGSAITLQTPSAGTGTILFIDINQAATRMAVRDLNKDGKPEIIVTASTADFIYVFQNTSSGGSLSFNATPLKFDIDPTGTNLRTYEAEVQDFDGDGLPDIVVNRFQDNNFYILKNTSTASISFATPVAQITPEDRDFNRINTADFNQDGKLDLVFTNSVPISQVTAVYLNTSTPGSISFTPDASAIKFTTSVGAWGIDVTDIDGDKDPDMVNANKDVNELNVFLHNGNFSSPNFTKVNIPTTSPTSWNTRNIKAGDMDGDGKTDLVYTAFNDLASTSSVEILRNAHCHQPEILNAEPLTICNSQTIVLKTIQANNVTYEWKKDGVVTGTNSPFLTITTGGTYRVTANAGACSLFDEIVVTTDASATPADPVIDANAPICVGGTLNLTVSNPAGGGTYTWTKPDGTTLTGMSQSFVVSLDDAGIYGVQVKVGACKSDVTEKRVDVANLANFAITANPLSATVCQGGNVALSVNNLTNHTYQWRLNGSDVTSGGTTNTLNVNAEGSYTVRITNTSLNCDTETSAVPVLVYQTPVADYSVKASACVGEQLTFTNNSTVDSRATVVNSWNFGDGNTSTTQSPTKTYNAPQNYNTALAVSYTGVTGCSANANKQVNITSAVLPTIQSTSPSLCPDDATPATLSIAGTFSSITWSTSETSASISVAQPGTYTVSTTDANGCPGNDDIVIDSKPLPSVTASAEPATIPSGATSQLTASGADSYVWATDATLSSTTIPNPIASPLHTTTYTVTGTLTGGCSASVNLEVTVAGTLGFPAAFSPNNDGIADVWDIRAQDKPDCTLSIFDARGRRVFEAKGENWDGTYEGKQVPIGTYYYVFGCPSEKPITGAVLIMR